MATIGKKAFRNISRQPPVNCIYVWPPLMNTADEDTVTWAMSARADAIILHCSLLNQQFANCEGFTGGSAVSLCNDWC